MSQRLYNRQELVNKEVENLRKNMIDVMDESIIFCYAKRQTHIAIGDNNGSQAVGFTLAILDKTKQKLQLL
jgi:hypothetical protein